MLEIIMRPQALRSQPPPDASPGNTITTHPLVMGTRRRRSRRGGEQKTTHCAPWGWNAARLAGLEWSGMQFDRLDDDGARSHRVDSHVPELLKCFWGWQRHATSTNERASR
jgi:hypothetical protein